MRFIHHSRARSGIVIFAVWMVGQTLLGSPVLAQVVYRVKDDAPVNLQAYLEQAIESGKIAHAERLKQAQAEVDTAKAERDRVRKAFRQYKAKKTEMESAEQKLKEAETNLAKVRSEPALKWPTLTVFDRKGEMGILPHGFGVSLILDDRRALIYVFTEQMDRQEGPLFKNQQETHTEIVPSPSPLLLTGTPTEQWSQGERVAGNLQKVYQIGPVEQIEGQPVYTLRMVDLMQYLEPIQQADNDSPGRRHRAQ